MNEPLSEQTLKCVSEGGNRFEKPRVVCEEKAKPLHSAEEAVKILLQRKPPYQEERPYDPPPNGNPIVSSGGASPKDFPEPRPARRLDGTLLSDPITIYGTPWYFNPPYYPHQWVHTNRGERTRPYRTLPPRKK